MSSSKELKGNHATMAHWPLTASGGSLSIIRLFTSSSFEMWYF